MQESKGFKLPTDEFVRVLSNKNLLFHDQFNEPYLAVNGSGAKILKIGKSASFTGWLNYCSCKDYNVILKNNQVKDITCGLTGLALCDESEMHHLEPRLQRIGDDIWYDLGKEAVLISSKGWKVVKNPPIIFRRYSHQKPQVRPIRGGSIQEFRKFTNIINDKDWNLFLAFTITALIPDIPKPVLILNGSQGAGKSTPMRMLKDLLDPSQLTSAGKITGEKELAFLASRHSLLFFDNLSFLERDNSDLLCRLITGDGFSKRKLYTDDDEVIYNFKRPLMLNGINNFVTQADLLDRALIINIKRISEEKRLTELELWSKFNEEKPLILGAMFTVLSKAMELFPKTPTSGLPRMADFGRWGCAVFSAINNKPFKDFQSILSGNKERQIEESIEADPVALVAKHLANMSVRAEFTAYSFLRNACAQSMETPSTVLYANEDMHWPKDSSQVGKRLRRAEGMLREAGIEVSFIKRGNERLIQLVDTNYLYPNNVPFYRLGDRCFGEMFREWQDVDCADRRKMANMTPEECRLELKRRKEESYARMTFLALKTKLEDLLEQDARSHRRAMAHKYKIEKDAKKQEQLAKKEAPSKSEVKSEDANNYPTESTMEDAKDVCPF